MALDNLPARMECLEPANYLRFLTDPPKSPMMTKRHNILAFLGGITVVTLVGCGRGRPSSPTPRANASDSDPDRKAVAPTTSEPLELRDLDGRAVNFWEPAAAVRVAIFVRTDCPISNRYAPEVGRIVRRFAPQGVQFQLIYVDPKEPVENIRQHLKEFDYPCGALRDPGHRLVRLAGARVTPEVVVFDASRQPTYRGRIDDLYITVGKSRPAATRHDLIDAIEATLAGKPVVVPETKALGCYIGDLRTDYHSTIAPLMAKHCGGCHRPGEGTPFSLLTFEDARQRAKQIADVTGTGFMPPWLPKSGYGDFQNARRLTADEIAAFASWADAGAPEGTAGNGQPAANLQDEWRLGPPDLILQSPEFTLNAEGGDQFRNFVLPVELRESKWVRAIELRPTNSRVTHHARLGIDASRESVRRDAEDPQPGYAGMAWGQDPEGQLVAWTPGMSPDPGSQEMAWKLTPQTCLVLHSHLQPSGKVETTGFKVGIHFADKPPSVRPLLLRIGGRAIDIPAGDPDWSIRDEYRLPIAVEIRSIFPHAHSLCREIRVEAITPSGETIPLIWIERFDENWHENYLYAKPQRLPAGTRLVSLYRYDNSDANPRNRHHPPQRVVFGSNADNEMADVYLQVIPQLPSQREVLAEDYQSYDARAAVIGYLKALEVDPDEPWNLEGLAAAHFSLKEFDKAIEVFDRRLRVPPASAQARLGKGMAQIATQDLIAAERTLRDVLTEDPQSALAWFGLGQTLGGRGDAAGAQDAFRRALQISPGLDDARLRLVESLLVQAKVDEAAVLCESDILMSPRPAPFELKLAEIAARRGNWDACREHLDAALAIAPYTHPPLVLMAVFRFQLGDAEEAKRLLEQARAETPASPVPGLFLGQFAARENRWSEAGEFLKAAFALPIPDSWPASHRRTFLNLLHGERLRVAEHFEDVDLAREVLTDWTKLEPDNAALRSLLESL